ncbi:hypothetical protein B0H10DRAFT_723752 [Mycena sp. CBHHK59/15]|nr:hypothetical protein B0H10DRAFT_723752 [Mycena sp. CBHHK59/15]
MKIFIKSGTMQTTHIVQDVLKLHSQLGLTTKEIYERAHIMFPGAKAEVPPRQKPRPGARGGNGKLVQPPPEPPHWDHPIRSVAYLKRCVLEELQEQGVIEKVILRMGPVPNDGSRMDTIRAKGADDVQVPAVAHKLLEWRWRLRSQHPMNSGRRDPDPKKKDIPFPQLVRADEERRVAHLRNSQSERDRPYEDRNPPPDRRFFDGSKPRSTPAYPSFPRISQSFPQERAARKSPTPVRKSLWRTDAPMGTDGTR